MRKVFEPYAVLTVAPTGGRKTRHRVRLPFTVGASAANAVVVNARSLPASAYRVDADGRTLAMRRLSDGTALPTAQLERLGVAVLGPVYADLDQPPFRRAFAELLAREAVLFDKLPTTLRGIMLGALPQKIRLLVLSAVVFAGAMTAINIGNTPDAAPDLSSTPEALGFDAIRLDTLAYHPRKPSTYGYARGAMFAIEAPKGAENSASLLSFNAAGLNIGKELKFLVNGALVYETAAASECSQEFCQKTVRVERGIIKPGQNLLTIVHAEPKSSYFLAKLHLASLPPLSATEAEEIRHSLDIAQRDFDERNVTPQNLVSAGRYAQIALKLSLERDGGNVWEAKSRVMKNDIDRSLAEVTAALWTEVFVKEKVGKRGETQPFLEQLMRLHPEPGSEENNRVKEKLLKNSIKS